TPYSQMPLPCAWVHCGERHDAHGETVDGCIGLWRHAAGQWLCGRTAASATATAAGGLRHGAGALQRAWLLGAGVLPTLIGTWSWIDRVAPRTGRRTINSLMAQHRGNVRDIPVIGFGRDSQKSRQ